MLSTASQDKQVHIVRRFMEGWFAVFLIIFLATLAVRIFFFQTNTTAINHWPVALSSSNVKAHQLFHYGRTLVNSSKLHLVPENQISFEHRKELTAN